MAPNDKLIFVREEGRLSVDEFREILVKSTIRRPVDDLERLRAMIEHCSLLITARDERGRLLGLARSLTDFAYCCYLSELCVDQAWQKRGIGTALMAETKRIIGPGCTLVLLSAPEATSYYPQFGMRPITHGFMSPRSI